MPDPHVVIDHCIVCGTQLPPNPAWGYCSTDCELTDIRYQLRHRPYWHPYIPLQVSFLVKPVASTPSSEPASSTVECLP